MKKITIIAFIFLISLVNAAFAASKTTINASQKLKWTNGLAGLWSFDGPDIDGRSFEARKLLTKSFCII